MALNTAESCFGDDGGFASEKLRDSCREMIGHILNFAWAELARTTRRVERTL